MPSSISNVAERYSFLSPSYTVISPPFSRCYSYCFGVRDLLALATLNLFLGLKFNCFVVASFVSPPPIAFNSLFLRCFMLISYSLCLQTICAMIFYCRSMRMLQERSSTTDHSGILTLFGSRRLVAFYYCCMYDDAFIFCFYYAYSVFLIAGGFNSYASCYCHGVCSRGRAV